MSIQGYSRSNDEEEKFNGKCINTYDHFKMTVGKCQLLVMCKSMTLGFLSAVVELVACQFPCRAVMNMTLKSECVVGLL